MVDSKGGFLVDEGGATDERIKMLEKQRADQRAAQKLDPPVFLDASKNPKCAECGSIDIDHLFKRVFGLLVCEKCKTEHPEKYSLLTKTECKEDYLLTDPELRDHEILPHLLKANPHKATWNNMMLFVRLQVETFAFQKWGGPDGLDKEWERRTVEAKKKKNKKFVQALGDLRRKTREGEWQRRQDNTHKHEFGVVEKDESGSGVQRCIECGFEIEVEEF
ncbi:DNA repair protein [Clavulina sp. PMI_390]|nr:DNA repair protein [Clavulina sp. PMI_390]